MGVATSRANCVTSDIGQYYDIYIFFALPLNSLQRNARRLQRLSRLRHRWLIYLFSGKFLFRAHKHTLRHIIDINIHFT